MSATVDDVLSLLDEMNEQGRIEYADYSQLHDAIAATLGGGKLTADDVREIVEKHWHDLPAEYDMPEAAALPEYSYNWQAIADELNATLGTEINGETSDGYHTFNELYHHRAVLFSVVVANHRDIAWKAKKHHDGTMYDGMFIVGIDTPWGQASYHYDIDPYWDMFDCEERESAPEWDGHTPDEAIERIGKLATLGSGKLTAEQVRKAISVGGVWDEDHAMYYVNRTDMQAIADELNATLGVGECEKLPQTSDTVCVVRRNGFEMQFGYWRCSECGCENFEGAKHCMNCGRKAVKR